MKELGERLKRLRTAKGLTQTELANLLKIKKASISAWENDKAAPKLDNMDVLRQVYGVAIDDILYGKDSVPMKSIMYDTVPLIAWNDIAEGGYKNLDNDGVVKGLVPVAVLHSSEAFATEVVGHSMTSNGSRSYPEGRIIICDPSLRDSVVNGQRVIALILSSNITTFKEYVEEDGRRWLRSLNDHAQYQPITEPFEVLAVVIGSHIPE